MEVGRAGAKGVLVVHIVSAGAWIAINVVMGVLVFTALAERGSTRALCYQALELFAVWPLIVAGLLCLAGGGDPPHWFLNLQADPIVDLQVKADRHTARARIARGEVGAVAHHDRDRGALRRVSGEGRPRDTSGTRAGAASGVTGGGNPVRTAWHVAVWVRSWFAPILVIAATLGGVHHRR